MQTVTWQLSRKLIIETFTFENSFIIGVSNYTSLLPVNIHIELEFGSVCFCCVERGKPAENPQNHRRGKAGTDSKLSKLNPLEAITDLSWVTDTGERNLFRGW